MSARKTIFPSSGLIGEDELYTGQPDLSHEDEYAAGVESPVNPKARGKGHAAYAAQDEMPPYSPKPKGFGGVAGLFGDSGPEHAGQEASSEDGLLSVITDAALAEECAKRVCPACAVKKEADDVRLRALADLDNAKKRLAREKEEQVRFAAETVLSAILPSLDNLDLALQHASTDKACKDFVTGVRMTRKLMGEALAQNGLVEVGEVGEEFNPAVHEAVGMVNSPEVPNGCVCGLLAHGYTLNGRLLRPAKVMVCKKG